MICLERLVSEMTYNVLIGMLKLNPTHSLTHWATSARCDQEPYVIEDNHVRPQMGPGSGAQRV